MNMENGTVINQYRIISAIGKGGMGEVFLAQDTKLDRKVTLEILPPEFANDADRRQPAAFKHRSSGCKTFAQIKKLENTMKTFLRMALLIFWLGVSIQAAETAYLYNARFVQAAPGRLLELIDLYKKQGPVYAAGGDEAPLIIRHTQGDKWDLMLLLPVGSYADYYRADRAEKRKQAAQPSTAKLKELIAWQEDLYVNGPPLADLKAALPQAGFFHVEIFIALPGKHAELYQEREMENTYQHALKRPGAFIFTRDQGAAWDLFTLGLYRDLKHYAESADIPEKDQEAAARAAGFESAKNIGPYLRTLIQQHHDTLAVLVK